MRKLKTKNRGSIALQHGNKLFPTDRAPLSFYATTTHSNKKPRLLNKLLPLLLLRKTSPRSFSLCLSNHSKIWIFSLNVTLAVKATLEGSSWLINFVYIAFSSPEDADREHDTWIIYSFTVISFLFFTNLKRSGHRIVLLSNNRPKHRKRRRDSLSLSHSHRFRAAFDLVVLSEPRKPLCPVRTNSENVTQWFFPFSLSFFLPFLRFLRLSFLYLSNVLHIYKRALDLDFYTTFTDRSM